MKVLVAIDNQPSSQSIIDALIKMHWSDGTEFYLTTVSPPESSRSCETHGGRQEMEEIAIELQNSLSRHTVLFFAPEGDPASLILETASRIKADLIVIGSNCKNSVERLLIGSVCQTVLDNAQCPVIVAKTPCCLAREASPGFKTILVPVDNSIYSDAVVSWLGRFAWCADSRFIIAAAVEADTSMSAVETSLHERAQTLSKLLQSSNVFVEAVLGEPKQAIINLAKKHYADMIAMGSHGRTGLKKLLMGNVAQSVSHDAPCAVAIIRGLVPDDTSWIETGRFEKIKPILVETLRYSEHFGRSDDASPRIMPGGMG